jgi:hypothetical protein
VLVLARARARANVHTCRLEEDRAERKEWERERERAIKQLPSCHRDFVSRTLHLRRKLPLIKIWAGKKKGSGNGVHGMHKRFSFNRSSRAEHCGITATQSSSDNGRGSCEWIFRPPPLCRLYFPAYVPPYLPLFLSPFFSRRPKYKFPGRFNFVFCTSSKIIRIHYVLSSISHGSN